jgi:hypothetical protein
MMHVCYDYMLEIDHSGASSDTFSIYANAFRVRDSNLLHKDTIKNKALHQCLMLAHSRHKAAAKAKKAKKARDTNDQKLAKPRYEQRQWSLK